MDDMYKEVREHLRKCHAQNTQEVYQKERNPVYQYNYERNTYVQGDNAKHTSWTFSLKLKVLVFIISVMTFSLYIYGGQDLKKGTTMAVNDIKAEINVLEQKEPLVKETMGYVKKAYHKVYDLTKEYTKQD
ncbi:MAG: hypothetical protein ACI4GW_02430 [Lachnospiraceae bacterium]